MSLRSTTCRQVNQNKLAQFRQIPAFGLSRNLPPELRLRLVPAYELIEETTERILGEDVLLP